MSEHIRSIVSTERHPCRRPAGSHGGSSDMGEVEVEFENDAGRIRRESVIYDLDHSDGTDYDRVIRPLDGKEFVLTIAQTLRIRELTVRNSVACHPVFTGRVASRNTVSTGLAQTPQPQNTSSPQTAMPAPMGTGMLIAAEIGQALAGPVCFLNASSIAEVAGLRGGFNDIATASLCLAGQVAGPTAHSLWAPRVSRTAHLVSDLIQGGVAIGSLSLFAVTDNPTAPLTMAIPAFEAILTGRLRRLSPIAGDISYVALSGINLGVGLYFALSPTGNAGPLYRDPSSYTSHYDGRTASHSLDRLGLNLSILGSAGLATGVFMLVGDIMMNQRGDHSTPPTPRAMVLPYVTGDGAGLRLTGTF